jgi:hypothetical protein
MTNALRLGIGRRMIPIPPLIWRRVVRARGRKAGAGLAFMSEDHHRVRDYAVLELARTGAPLSPETIAAALDIEPPRVATILDELEKRMTFVFRSDGRNVTWAYPVTVEETPHHARFSSGEEAWSP